MIVQDVIDWCTRNKYPLTAELKLDTEGFIVDSLEDESELVIGGCCGHGHDHPEILYVKPKGA